MAPSFRFLFIKGMIMLYYDDEPFESGLNSSFFNLGLRILFVIVYAVGGDRQKC